MSANVSTAEKVVKREINYTICKNPSTGEEIGKSKLNTPDDLRNAVAKAKKVQPQWAEKSFDERKKAMLKVRDYVVENADELADIINRDNGKTRTEAMTAEILGTVMHIDYLAKNAKRLLKEKRLKPANQMLAYKSSKIVRVPLGVVGIISPWNYPFNIPFVEIVAALMAGNAVISKVATETQMIGRAIEQCIMAAELPEGLFHHLNIPGRMIGDAMLSSGIDKLFFTGSVEVGKELMRKASETLTPVSLELGGNDPMLVFPDADIFRAASGALWAGMTNCGQTCASVERIYVHKDAYQPFVDTLSEMTEALRIGQDVDYSIDISAITIARQMKKIQDQIDDAVAKGAKIYAQAKPPFGTKGNFMPAVVLTDVDHSMRVMSEETFGPVIGIMKVDDMDEAVSLANDSNLGLTTSVWSKDRKKAGTYARKIHAGAVMINDHLMSNGLPETPWGGFKESGIGRTHGELGLKEMTQSICVVQDYLIGAKRNMWWFPHEKSVYDGILGMIQFLFSKNLKKRLTGGLKLTKTFLRTFTRKD